MTREEKVAYINSQIACMLAEMEGMKAANAHCAVFNETPVHSEQDFLDLPVRYGVTHNQVLGYLRD